MIRPFDWRDLSLLHRLRDRGLCLDSQQALSRGPQALTNALLGAFSPAGSACTLVARPADKGETAAVGQILHRNGDPLSRLIFFGPEEAMAQSSGVSLLEALCQAAGARGARNLVAEVDEESPVFQSLRRSGFAIYARQRIWRLCPSEDRRAAPRAIASGDQDAAAMWRPESSADSPATRLLYTNLVPALVQQIEPPPGRSGHGLAHWREGELLGYLEIERGPLGIWIQPYFHPAAERPDDLLAGSMRHLGDSRNRPLYMCVRSYQGWMNDPLERLGFETGPSQAVMVKRLAVLLRRPALASLPALEATRPEPTAPFAHLDNQPPASGTGRQP